MKDLLKWVGKMALGAAVGAGAFVIFKPCPKPPVPEPVVIKYPIAAVLSHMLTTGDPFVIDGAHGGTQIDSALCKEQARYDVFVIDPEKRDKLGKQVLHYIHSLNPNAKMLAYFYASEYFVCGPGWYGQVPPYYGCDTTTASWDSYRVAKSHNAILFNSAGEPLSQTGGVMVDYAQPGFPEAYADVAADWALNSGVGLFAGVFTDGPCVSVANWYPGNQVDWHRQGFTSLADWDQHYQAGVAAYHRRLQERVGMVVGNCGPSGPLTANGWLGENHPEQNPVGWADWDSVLARADTAYASPQLSFISKPRPRWQSADGVWHVAPFTDPAVQRIFRFVVGSASLHDHVAGIVVGSPFDCCRGFMPDQWSSWYASFGSPEGVRLRNGPVTTREFTNGTLVVNPSSSSWLGTVEGRKVTVPANDALFVTKQTRRAT